MKGTLCEEYFYRPDQGHSNRKVTMKKKNEKKEITKLKLRDSSCGPWGGKKKEPTNTE